MNTPIIFAKCDGRPGKESLVLIFRPDRSIDREEQQLTIRARSLDPEALGEIQWLLDLARPITDLTELGMHDGAIGPLRTDTGPPIVSVVW